MSVIELVADYDDADEREHDRDLDNATELRRSKMQERKRERRGLLAGNTAILDQFEPRIGETATLDEVAELLGVEATSGTLRNVLNRHSDELLADGWDRLRDTFTRRAIIRLAQIMRSDKARAITEAASARYRVISFGSARDRLQHTRRCQAVMDQALEIAERIKDEDPAENWQLLNGLDRYTLQAVIIALGSIVQLEAPGPLRWLQAIAPRHHVGGGRQDGQAASGLALIVPTPEASDSLAPPQFARFAE